MIYVRKGVRLAVPALLMLACPALHAFAQGDGGVLFNASRTGSIASLGSPADPNAGAPGGIQVGPLNTGGTPEPGSMAMLFGMSVTGLGVLRRRRMAASPDQG